MKTHIGIHLTFGDANASIVLRGQDYSPDVVDDLVRRATESLAEILYSGYSLSAGLETDDLTEVIALTADDIEQIVNGGSSGDESTQ